MGRDIVRETKDIVDDAIDGLSRGREAGAPGSPQYFFAASSVSRLIINIELAGKPAADLDDILAAIYDFLEARTALEDGNIYLTRLAGDSILIEPSGRTVYAEAFLGDVDRSHYKEFHKAVRSVKEAFPAMSSWDGTPAGLPGDFRSGLRACVQGPGAAGGAQGGKGPVPESAAAQGAVPAVHHHGDGGLSVGRGPGGPGPSATKPEPDIQDCERKMREWYKMGLRIDRLKDSLHEDWATIVRTFERYELDVARLLELRTRLDAMKGLGFDQDARRLAALLNDPGKVPELEAELEGLKKRIREKYAINLPVSDRVRLSEAVKGLPLGIPSSLWGIPLDTLIGEFLSAERGVVPDGSVVVLLRGMWYHADPASPDFLSQFSGLVRTRREMFPEAARVDQLR
jgi:hypothetical protein